MNILKIYIDLRDLNFKIFKTKSFFFSLFFILIILYFQVYGTLIIFFFCYLNTPHNENINENFNSIIINFYLKNSNIHNTIIVVVDKNKIKYNIIQYLNDFNK